MLTRTASGGMLVRQRRRGRCYLKPSRRLGGKSNALVSYRVNPGAVHPVSVATAVSVRTALASVVGRLGHWKVTNGPEITMSLGDRPAMVTMPRVTSASVRVTVGAFWEPA